MYRSCRVSRFMTPYRNATGMRSAHVPSSRRECSLIFPSGCYTLVALPSSSRINRDVMAARQREIQEQILLIASLYRKLEAHRRKPIVRERRWRREEIHIVQRLAKAYAAL